MTNVETGIRPQYEQKEKMRPFEVLTKRSSELDSLVREIVDAITIVDEPFQEKNNNNLSIKDQAQADFLALPAWLRIVHHSASNEDESGADKYSLKNKPEGWYATAGNSKYYLIDENVASKLANKLSDQKAKRKSYTYDGYAEARGSFTTENLGLSLYRGFLASRGYRLTSPDILGPDDIGPPPTFQEWVNAAEKVYDHNGTLVSGPEGFRWNSSADGYTDEGYNVEEYWISGTPNLNVEEIVKDTGYGILRDGRPVFIRIVRHDKQ